MNQSLVVGRSSFGVVGRRSFGGFANDERPTTEVQV